jgi:hypothetical protein
MRRDSKKNKRRAEENRKENEDSNESEQDRTLFLEHDVENFAAPELPTSGRRVHVIDGESGPHIREPG